MIAKNPMILFINTFLKKMENILLPYEIVNIILEYDGRFRYLKGERGSCNQKWISIFHPRDERYVSIQPDIEYKYSIQQNIKMWIRDTSPDYNSYIMFYELNKKYSIKIIFPNIDLKVVFISQT